ncbi:MAG: hypothetical protein WC045_02155 [Patescibacteria group bacterium]
MSDRPKEKRQFEWHLRVNTSSTGTANLSLFFPEGATKKEKEAALAAGLDEATQHMLSQGYILPSDRFMSSGDVALKYGKSRQYWEKLLVEGKIPYMETSAGKITTDLWVRGYLDNRSEVDVYVQKSNLAVKRILDELKKHTTELKLSTDIRCPNCEEDGMSCYINRDHFDGMCSSCKFKLRRTK